METKFNEIKEVILQRAKNNNACVEEFKEAFKSNSMSELCQVLKDNFNWGCNNGVITPDIIDLYAVEFAECEIWHNVNVKCGFLLTSGSSTVEASGSSTVRAFGSSTVRASGSSTVEASDSSTVEASGSSTVRASGSSTVEASDSSTVRAFGSSTVRASGSSTVRAFGSSTVRASGSSTVEASDSSYTYCSSFIECKISNKAIIRRCDTNTIEYCSDDLSIVKKATD
jgi:hypothetical protein